MKELIESELSDYVYMKDPKGGLYFYLKFRDKNMSSKELFYNLKKRNVYITPGAVFYKQLEEGLDSFRIGFSILLM